jgi:hypothetical protein
MVRPYTLTASSSLTHSPRPLPWPYSLFPFQLHLPVCSLTDCVPVDPYTLATSSSRVRPCSQARDLASSGLLAQMQQRMNGGDTRQGCLKKRHSTDVEYMYTMSNQSDDTVPEASLGCILPPRHMTFTT